MSGLTQVNSVKFCPSSFGLRLACCTAKGSLIIYTFKEGQWDKLTLKLEHAHQNSTNAVTWAPSGHGLTADPHAPVIATASCDKSIKLFAIRDGIAGLIQMRLKSFVSSITISRTQS